MIDSVFRHEFKQANGVLITDGYILFRKPLELYDMKNNISVFFKTLGEAYEFKINDKTIKEIITDASIDLFKMKLEGGSGASSPKGEFSFNVDGVNEPDRTRSDLPARMNTRIKTKTENDAIRHFRNTHANDNYESAITIDRDGFVTQYVHGNPHSVAIQGRKGEMVIHNHPSGGNFSGADLLNVSTTAASGVVASGKHGDYIFRKGTHFKGNEFAKAVNTAKLRGDDYNTAADRWLKRNQKKYGYKYEFRKSKSDRKTKAPTPKLNFDSSGQGVLF